MSKLNLYTCEAQDVVHKLEKQWGDELSHIALLKDNPEDWVFTCTDLGDEAILRVYKMDGYVTVKAHETRYADVLGTIE